MKKVWSPSGYKLGVQGSWVGKGESLINYDEGKGQVVTKGSVGKDNQPSSITEGDNNVIAGNDIDWSNGISFAKQVAPMTALLNKINKAEDHRSKSSNLSSLSKNTQRITDQEKGKLLSQMKEITDRQEQQHAIEDAVKYNNTNEMLYANNGKDTLPGYEEGKSTSKSRSSISVRTSSGRIPWAYRFMPGLVGMGAEAYMYDWWRRNPIKYHSTYARNPYERQALRTMAQNRINPYNAIRAAQDAERRGEYRIDQSGGLTGAQRYLAKVAGTLGNAQNMANIYQEADEKNATLRNQYAEAAAKIGEQDAQRAQHANQHDWDDYVAAHGRKTKGIETHIAGFVNQLNHMYANEAKYKMWRDSIDMYQQQMDDEQRRWINTVNLQKEYYNSLKDGNGSTHTVNASTGPIYTNPYTGFRFPSMQEWISGQNPSVKTPNYFGVRGGSRRDYLGPAGTTNTVSTTVPNQTTSTPGSKAQQNTNSSGYSKVPRNRFIYGDTMRYNFGDGNFYIYQPPQFGYGYRQGWNFMPYGGTNYLEANQFGFNTDGPNGLWRLYGHENDFNRGKDRKKGFRK